MVYICNFRLGTFNIFALCVFLVAALGGGVKNHELIPVIFSIIVGFLFLYYAYSNAPSSIAFNLGLV